MSQFVPFCPIPPRDAARCRLLSHNVAQCRLMPIAKVLFRGMDKGSCATSCSHRPAVIVQSDGADFSLTSLLLRSGFSRGFRASLGLQSLPILYLPAPQFFGVHSAFNAHFLFVCSLFVMLNFIRDVKFVITSFLFNGVCHICKI